MIERLKNRWFLIENLCFLYRIIAASEPLLKLAINKSEGALRAFYVHHLDDERGHQRMLQQDLFRLGVREPPRSYLAAQVAGSQYYFVRHDNPALLLGYMHCLERNPLPVDAIDMLENFHNAKLTCARHHAIHDPAHKAELEAQIKAQPESARALIAWNESCTQQALHNVFENMWAQAQEQERQIG